jgi:aerobic-type carbon monoxide dehydrogenase small subunit (CoxS/CutS family)
MHIELNGDAREADVDPRSLLVEALRDDFGAYGPKIGCLTGDCGACTVRVDGRLRKACMELAVAHEGARVTTLEGLSGPEGQLTRLQQAFWDNHAFQCGFCLSGMLFAAEELLERVPEPDEAQIRDAIGGNLCRCTGYDAIVTAVQAASGPAATAGER